MRPIGVAVLELACIAGEAFAQDLTVACRRSQAANLVSAEFVEKAAENQYAKLLEDARSKNALAPQAHPQVVRLRYIVDRMVPFTEGCNERADSWNWQINLIGSRQLHFQGLEGGRLVVFYGVLSDLQLDDDELAALVAHTMAESLLEFGRERLAKQALNKAALEQGLQTLGLGASSPSFDMSSKLLELQQSRQQQLEADRLGVIVAARAGYQPQAFVSLWQKLWQRQEPTPALLSRYPPLQVQIAELERQLPSVIPVYQKATRPDRRFGPPAPPQTPSTPSVPASSAPN